MKPYPVAIAPELEAQLEETLQGNIGGSFNCVYIYIIYVKLMELVLFLITAKLNFDKPLYDKILFRQYGRIGTTSI